MALFALDQNNKEWKQRHDEDREYNKNVTRNRQPIAESNQRVIQPTPDPGAGAVDTAAQPVTPAVNGASNRFASADMFGPVGMDRSIDPNLRAKGQFLFDSPGERIFAAKGGIMSTNKAFQRVA